MSTFPIKIFRVEDRSMEPAIRSGDYLIVNLWYGSVKVNDLVVLRHPKKQISIIKRVSAISNNLVYVSGDNGAESEDSRSFGGVEKERIIGKVVFRI
jgi:signal peptidase I